jgi:hypothetical protein
MVTMDFRPNPIDVEVTDGGVTAFVSMAEHAAAVVTRSSRRQVQDERPTLA